MPVAASHTRAVLSPDAVTARARSGLYEVLVTKPLWPTRRATSLLATAPHARAVLSPDAVTTRPPGGLNEVLKPVAVAHEACDLLAGHHGPHPRRVVL